MPRLKSGESVCVRLCNFFSFHKTAFRCVAFNERQKIPFNSLSLSLTHTEPLTHEKKICFFVDDRMNKTFFFQNIRPINHSTRFNGLSTDTHTRTAYKMNNRYALSNRIDSIQIVALKPKPTTVVPHVNRYMIRLTRTHSYPLWESR